METPLTPLEFARRARKIHARREAVVDGDLRLTYGAFFFLSAPIAGPLRWRGSVSDRVTVLR